MGEGQRSEKICVFVDNNALSRILNGRKVNFKLLKNWLAGDREAVVSIFYCGETNRNLDSRHRLYDSMRLAGFDVRIMRNPVSRAGHPELDDEINSAITCQITWDMSQLLQQGYYDSFVVLTGAYEMAQVAQEIRRKGVEVEVVFDPNQCSPSLRGASNKFRELSLESVLLPEKAWSPHPRMTEKVTA